MDVVMPKMGESVSEGTILKWHKKVGEKINQDEILLEISTDKVDTEIPSPAEGVVKEIKAEEGDAVEVGNVVAVLEVEGEEESAETGQSDEEKTGTETQAEPKEEEPEEEEKPAGNGEVINIEMPKMGESVTEGTIIKWYKKAGEKVNKDETIFEISTDKVDTEVPSPEEGVLQEILVAEQETVEVGTIVAKLKVGEGEVPVKSGKPAQPKKDSEQVKEKEEQAEKVEEKKAETEQEQKPEENGEDIKEKAKEAAGFYSPLVLSIAQKENVTFTELEKIEGTGLGGRVTKKDVLAFIEDRKSGKLKEPEKAKEEKAAPAAKEKTPSPAPSFSYSDMEPSYTEDEIEKIPMDNVRQKIMQHMINSRDTSVHVAAMLEVDMTKIHNYIQANRDEFKKKEGVKLTYMSFIAYAVIKALKEFPLVNSTIEGSDIIRKKFINLGIAVAIEPTGLIVPNIKNADEKNIIGLAKSINDLATRARSKKLSPDDITNGTFTITNYGVFGTIIGTPIINQPEVSILGVGTVTKKPVVVEVDGSDTIAVKPIMALTLSHDHRLIDGMLGGKFLKFMKDTLENFNVKSV